jgi:AcrR family transcriptional regulator
MMDRGSLRADAAGNRARIIAAARAAIASSAELKLNAIARSAGVGQGTLYRHFPTREDLLAEVYREDVGELVAAAPELLARHEPLPALARWLDRVADYAQVKRGVFGAVEAAVSADLAAHSLGPIGEALTLLLDAGKSAGTIRLDVDARDVILLIGYLTRLERDEWDARARHLLGVILDGLRVRLFVLVGREWLGSAGSGAVSASVAVDHA